jgi:hypothetical protein
MKELIRSVSSIRKTLNIQIKKGDKNADFLLKRLPIPAVMKKLEEANDK